MTDTVGNAIIGSDDDAPEYTEPNYGTHLKLDKLIEIEKELFDKISLRTNMLSAGSQDDEVLGTLLKRINHLKWQYTWFKL